MSTTPTSHDERDDIEKLLPWYAVGTLERSEAERVEAYLDGHPEIRDQLLLVAEEADETIAVNEALGAPSPGAIDRLMERVAQDGPVPAAHGQQSLWQRIIGQFADMSPGVAAFGTAAAIVIICIQAVALGLVMTGEQKQSRTASGEETQVETGTVALVIFSAGATVEQVNELLAASGTSIVDGPKAGGIYRVRVSETVLPDAERDAVLEKLRSNPLVQFAEPAS